MMVANTQSSFLDTKIPPVVWWVMTAAVVWLVSSVDPLGFEVNQTARTVSVIAAVSALAVGASAVVQFLRAKTTINPHAVDRSSVIVTTGIYRWTRNPMYVALLLCLVAWAVSLGSPLGLLVGSMAFVSALTRFQIRPEERALVSKHGEAYRRYLADTPRWLFR